MLALPWFRQLERRCFPRRVIRQAPVRRRVRPLLEVLEDRTVPAVFNVGPGDVATLIADINTANTNGDATNTINLSNSTYNLMGVNNVWYGPDGLPAISSNLTINGNGATIQRGAGANYRLFYVSGGQSNLAAGTLTLNNLTLAGGVADGGDGYEGGGGLGAGGAIFNQGTLNLNSVTLTNDAAVGGNSGDLALGFGGGGIGENAPPQNAPNFRDGGGFGGGLVGGPFGGNGGAGGIFGGGGGGGGFQMGDNGQTSGTPAGGAAGGVGGFGGNGGGGAAGGDGGGGGSSPSGTGGAGGNFGLGGGGGTGGNSGGDGGGGGGGVGGGGGGSAVGNGGGGGFGGGGGAAVGIGGKGGFGGGGGFSGGGTAGTGGFGGGNGASGVGGNNGFGGGGAGMGGAIFNMFGTANLTNCTLTADTAQGGSGGNTAGVTPGGGGSGYGGAIFNLDGNLNLTFCTLASNTVAGGAGATPGNAAGGAVYNLAFGNTLTGGTQTATSNLTDSILANTTGGVGLVNNVMNGANPNTAIVNVNGPNIVTTRTGNVSGSQPLVVDPQLGPLQNNGGPGMPTMAISSSSPAFQVGTAVAGVTTDQRGFARPATPSLGAFEPAPTPPAPPPPVVATIQFTSVSLTPNLAAFNETETIKVHVSQGGGTVAFAVGGQNVQAAVDGSGNATVTLTVPLLSVISPQSITANYNGAGATGNAETTARWFLFNAFLSAIDMFLADGTQIVTFYFGGSPLLFIVWSPSGQITGFGLGAG